MRSKMNPVLPFNVGTDISDGTNRKRNLLKDSFFQRVSLIGLLDGMYIQSDLSLLQTEQFFAPKQQLQPKGKGRSCRELMVSFGFFL